MSKKNILIVLFSIFLFANAFAQTQKEQNTPVGKWAKSFGTSEYFLEINDTEIKYINKKSEKYIRFKYRLENGTKGTPWQFKISGYYQDNTLDSKSIEEDFKRSVDYSIIPYTFNGETLTIYLLNNKNKFYDFKMIPIEKKEKTVDTWKKIGIVAGVTAATVLTAEAADHVIDKTTMQSIANDCLEALDNSYGY